MLTSLYICLACSGIFYTRVFVCACMCTCACVSVYACVCVSLCECVCVCLVLHIELFWKNSYFHSSSDKNVRDSHCLENSASITVYVRSNQITVAREAQFFSALP